jgi:hypothetical protein
VVLAPQPLETRRKAAMKKIVLFMVVMTMGIIAVLAVLGSRNAPGPTVFVVFG